MNRICFVDDAGTLCFLPEKDYAKKENWDVIRQSVVDRYSDLYSYLVAHRSDFVKSVGERTVHVAGAFVHPRPDGLRLRQEGIRCRSAAGVVY